MVIRTANACYKDAADLHAELGEYPQAISRYDQIADHALTSALTKYSVKEYWLRSGLCALAMKVNILTHNILIRVLNMWLPGLRDCSQECIEILWTRPDLHFDSGMQVPECAYRSLRKRRR
jgi:hypothetical protein